MYGIVIKESLKIIWSLQLAERCAGLTTGTHFPPLHPINGYSIQVTHLPKLKMKEYCIVNEDSTISAIGTKAEIISALCGLKLVGESRTIHLKLPGYQEVILNGYTEEFSDEEALSHAINTVVWRSLPDYGFRIFQSI